MKNLSEYRKKRDKAKTPEPFTSKSKDPKNLSFVVQKHQATALHYDFRLETSGVMPSWAVPKGPTLDSSVKRLAMKTEDHPIDYRHFEGTIPKGEYGGGEVIIWDSGTYIPEVEENGKRVQINEKKKGQNIMEEAIKKGEIKFFLKGKRLRGSFALIKTKGFGGKNAWLLIKHKDNYVKSGFDAKNFNKSVVSNKIL